jgi:hypothetical protein
MLTHFDGVIIFTDHQRLVILEYFNRILFHFLYKLQKFAIGKDTIIRPKDIVLEARIVFL